MANMYGLLFKYIQDCQIMEVKKSQEHEQFSSVHSNSQVTGTCTTSNSQNTDTNIESQECQDSQTVGHKRKLPAWIPSSRPQKISKKMKENSLFR